MKMKTIRSTVSDFLQRELLYGTHSMAIHKLVFER